MCQQTELSICCLDIGTRGSSLDREHLVVRVRVWRTSFDSQDYFLVLVRVRRVLVALFVVSRSRTRTRTVGVGPRSLRRWHGGRG